MAPIYTHTSTDFDTPKSCMGFGACEGVTSFAIKDTSVWNDGGNMIASSYYSGQVPPVECSDGCDVEATRVRILFWPVNDNSTTLQNVTDAAKALPYTTVSDGFTL